MENIMRIIPAIIMTTSIAVLLTACNTGNVSSEKSATTGSNNATNVAIPTGTGIINVSNDQLQALLDKGVTLVDIRRPEEWKQTGVVPGSKKLTFFSGNGINPNLATGIKKIAPVDKPVALICRTGNRTRVGAQMIQAQLGYKTVYNVERGITKWISEGRETVK
jgi:rhodanese-related sulfurtransferase